MATTMLAHDDPVEGVDLEALDAFLSSDRAPRGAMMLPHLDGFLTGIAVGPKLVLPSEWLPLVWGGETAPEFASENEANAIIAALIGRYNVILRQVADESVDPIFWVDRDGTLIAFDWAEGFLQAMLLRADAWERLFRSKRDNVLLFPILALCGDENGESLLGLRAEDEDRLMDDAAEIIPACVAEIAALWRGPVPRQISMPVLPLRPAQSNHRSRKIGRNEPCPCGSGRKFKKCCAKLGFAEP